ncbi:MAG: hypothetical protein WKF31_01100 [Thermoleophilaceae bacterium]
MNTMATPAASQASTTSGSRREPPGWMIERTPASMASWGPSANGKKASEAMAAPSSGTWAFSMARRTESTRLIWPAPMPPVASSLARTIAFERTCLHVFHANSSSPHSASLGLRSVTTCISSRGSMSWSRSWTRSPPRTRRMSCSLTGVRRRSRSSRMRTLSLWRSTSQASSS